MIPLNISKVHASIANFTAEIDNFSVEILIASCAEETAYYIRKVAEMTRKASKVLHLLPHTHLYDCKAGALLLN